jgi:hypothetical protein
MLVITAQRLVWLSLLLVLVLAVAGCSNGGY